MWSFMSPYGEMVDAEDLRSSVERRPSSTLGMGTKEESGGWLSERVC
jgi:hypothetical protein